MTTPRHATSRVTLAVLLVAVLASCMSAPSATARFPVGAQAALRPLRIDATVHGNFLSTGASNVLAGTLSDRALGTGALVERTRQSGTSFTGQTRYVDGTGTLTWSEKLSTTPGAGGSLSVTGTWKAIGGTGRYAHPSGTGTVRGTVNTQTGATRLAYRGALNHRPAAARFGAARAHPYRATVTAVLVDLASNGVETLAGPTRGLTPPAGMFVFRVKRSVPQARATFVYYDGRGTLSGHADIQRVPNPDGSTTVVSRGGGFTRGTGRYARFHARGTHTFSGRRDPRAGVVTLNLSGTLVY